MSENRYQSTDPNELIRELKNIRQTLESHTDHNQFQEEAEYYQMFVDVVDDLEEMLTENIDQLIKDITALDYNEYQSIHQFLREEELYEEFTELYDIDKSVEALKETPELVTGVIIDDATCMRKLLSEYRDSHFTVHHQTNMKGHSVFKIYKLRLVPALKAKDEG